MSDPPQSSALNEPQTTAALHPTGPLLVFAGAGSGKTRTLTYRIANLIARGRIAPYRILAVTFTNKAAFEMRSRVQSLVGEDIARDLWIGTFHGTCAKLLRRYHDEAGLPRSFVIYDDSDQKAVLGRIIKEKGLDDRIYAPKAVLARISAAKREGLDPLEVDLGDGFDQVLVELGRAYQTAMRRFGAVDFDDLLLYVLRLVEDSESSAGRSLRNRYEHVLVDEFQDTNWVQYRIVRALTAESRNLCVVGDDDQAIYRWRGADVRIIRGFRDDFPETLVVKLEQNYRSSGNIVRTALAMIEPAQSREPKELWTAEAAGEKVLVRACPDERTEAAFVANGLLRGQAAGISASDQAVFYRIHAQSRVLEEALRGARVPYQIIGGMKFFERAEIKDMLAYLRLLENENSDPDFLRIVNVPARGIGQKTVRQLVDVAAENTSCLSAALADALADGTLKGAAKKKLEAFFALLADLKSERDRRCPSDLLEYVLDITGYRNALERDDSAESDARLQNLAELLGSIREYENEAPDTGEQPTLSGYLERVSLVTAADAIEDVPKVSLMTVHAAKGLEFEQVWLTGMEEETFPFRGLSGDDPEELDEERRLAYVAVTRAKKQLSISHAGQRFLFGKTRYSAPSRFLSDLPVECIEKSGEMRPQVSLAGGMTHSSANWSPGYQAANRWQVNNAGSVARSPGGRGASSHLRLSPGQHAVDSDVFSDTSSDEFNQDVYDDAEPVIVRPGQSVRHRKFGHGVVERVEAGAKPTVVARFPGHGPKRILAEFLEFE